MNRRIGGWMIVFSILGSTLALGQTEPSTDSRLTDDEAALVALAKQCDEEVIRFMGFMMLAQATQRDGGFAYFRDHEMTGDCVPKLLDFESQHRGERVGLMALRKIFGLAIAVGFPGEKLRAGKREALARLIHYVALPELTAVLSYLGDGGYREPAVENALRILGNDSTALDEVRVCAQYRLAQWMLSARIFVENRELIETRNKELESATDFDSKLNALISKTNLLAHPDDHTFKRWEQEAYAIIEELQNDAMTHRESVVTNIDEEYVIVKHDAAATVKNATVAELARGLLNREQHLRIGTPAQGLTLKLVNGKSWSLAALRGRVVVIQFSFTGCGPCRQMYPFMDQIAKHYRESVTMVSIMRDADLETTLQTIRDDDLSWDVAFDEKPGKIRTQWGVTWFPTVYVIGKDGKTAAIPHSGEELVAAIARLTS